MQRRKFSREFKLEAVRSVRERGVTQRDNFDGWTSAAIQSEFDDLVLRRLLDRCIDMSVTIEAAAAFGGIIAKGEAQPPTRTAIARRP